MSLNLKSAPKGNGGGNRVEQPNLEPGTYPARVVQIIDYGLQAQRPYKGEDKPPAHEVGFTYELVDVFMIDEDGNELEDKPRWVSETFPVRNLDSDLAKSTKRYRAIDPNEDFGGDLTRLIGQPCMVNIVNNESKGKVYDNVKDVSTMRAAMVSKTPELKNDPRVFTLDEPDLDVFLSLPEWIQDKVKSNLEYDHSALYNALEEHSKGGNGDTKAKVKKAAKKAPVELPEDNEEEDAEW